MSASTREALITMLTTHRPEDEKEAADLLRMQGYALMLAEPFSRKQAEAHFTASAILADAAGRATCLVYHRKLERWLQPGGHFEPEDEGRAESAALREVAEETGCEAWLVESAPVPLDVDIHAIPAHGAEPAHLHLDLRLLACTAQHTPVLDTSEARSLLWLSWEDALTRSEDAALSRALRKAIRLLGR